MPGLAAQDQAGRWQGLETDFCRAVAAAVTGDPERFMRLGLPIALAQLAVGALYVVLVVPHLV